jgi:hypothetical protein
VRSELHLTPAIIALIHDLALAVGPRSPGGKKITPEEGQAISADAFRLAKALLTMIGTR